MNDTIIDIDDGMPCPHDECHENFICVGAVIFIVGGFGVGLISLIKFIVGYA